MTTFSQSTIKVLVQYVSCRLPVVTMLSNHMLMGKIPQGTTQQEDRNHHYMSVHKLGGLFSSETNCDFFFTVIL